MSNPILVVSKSDYQSGPEPVPVKLSDSIPNRVEYLINPVPNRSDRSMDSVTSNSADPSVSTCPTFQECVTPEQTNGLFVWAIARAIRECIAARRNRSSNIGLKKNK
ncbi:hypothetical protein Leryth_025939 [Lithospermum erythrorhizon]|nr:hypothetical protein Leryth_025939 [Lithospermum erythrorhizon]